MADDDRDGALAQAVNAVLDDTTRATPGAQLALVYATHIDAATHVPLALEKALRLIRATCEARDDAGALDALTKVTAALSAVTVAADLGPKLLAALDALLLTPKAKAALERKLPGGPGEPVNPLQKLRDQQDELKARRDLRRTS